MKDVGCVDTWNEGDLQYQLSGFHRWVSGVEAPVNRLGRRTLVRSCPLHSTVAYSFIRFSLTATKWYRTIATMAAMPRPFDSDSRVVSEIILIADRSTCCQHQAQILATAERILTSIEVTRDSSA